eukprot:758513-Hanusia_phi.AAC.1
MYPITSTVTDHCRAPGPRARTSASARRGTRGGRAPGLSPARLGKPTLSKLPSGRIPIDGPWQHRGDCSGASTRRWGATEEGVTVQEGVDTGQSTGHKHTKSRWGWVLLWCGVVSSRRSAHTLFVNYPPPTVPVGTMNSV